MKCFVLKNSNHVLHVDWNQISADLWTGWSYLLKKDNDGFLMNNKLDESKLGGKVYIHLNGL